MTDADRLARYDALVGAHLVWRAHPWTATEDKQTVDASVVRYLARVYREAHP